MTLALPKPTKPAPRPRTRLKRTALPRSSKPIARRVRPRPMAKGVLASMVRAADALFSKMVREREPICAACKKALTTDTAHHISRRYFATRWDMDNASGTCRPCHRLYTVNPGLWVIWWSMKLGLERTRDLLAASQSGCDKRAAVEEFLLSVRRRTA